MKKTLLITLSAAAAYFIYSLLKKEFHQQPLEGTTTKHKEHHITHVFAKAKKKLVS